MLPSSVKQQFGESTDHLRSRGKELKRQWGMMTGTELREGEDDADFMSETSAAVLQGTPRTAHWILMGTAGFFIVALIWASLAKLDEFARGVGKVIPTSHIQVVQNLEGGIISEILVQEGEVVQKGQVLVKMDPTRFVSSFGENQAKYDALMAAIARLTAEANNVEFTPPVELQKKNPKLVEDERALYLSRLNELQSNLRVLRQQMDQRSQELTEKRSRLVQLQQSHALVAKEVSMTRPLVEQGVMSEVELLRLERQLNDLLGELNATRLAIPRLGAALEEARSKAEGFEVKFRSDAREELNKARAEISATGASSTALEDRVARTTVRSPMAGTVKRIKITTIGGVIQPGMDLMEIVPLEDKLLVEAQVRPADIAFLQTGQEATVKLTAYDFSIYGGLPATLEYISADSITNDKGETFYIVKVRTNANYLDHEGKHLPIIPGMQASVDIRTGKKSVLTYLLKPIIKTKSTALGER